MTVHITLDGESLEVTPELVRARRGGYLLAAARGWDGIDEVQLTRWMPAHLRVVTIPIADADTLGDRETEIVAELDPPLNLAKVGRTRFVSSSRRFGSSTDARL